jgi:hypothetical protein
VGSHTSLSNTARIEAGRTLQIQAGQDVQDTAGRQFPCFLPVAARGICKKDFRDEKSAKTPPQHVQKNPRSTQKKFTGSRSTIMMECKISTDINSDEMQKILLYHG